MKWATSLACQRADSSASCDSPRFAFVFAGSFGLIVELVVCDLVGWAEVSSGSFMLLLSVAALPLFRKE